MKATKTHRSRDLAASRGPKWKQLSSLMKVFLGGLFEGLHSSILENIFLETGGHA